MTRHVDERQEELTDREQDLLAGIRRITGPTASDQARVRLALSGCLAAGALAPELPASLTGAGHGAGSGFASAGLHGLGKRIVTALVIGSVGFGAGFMSGRMGSREAPTVASARVAPSASLREAPRVAPSEVIADSPPKTPHGEEEPSQTRSVGPKAVGPSSKGRVLDARSLTEEADTLRRIGQALREGQSGMAGQMLDDLDARIPSGALGEERRAARLMVACRTGGSGARAAALAWLARHGRSVYAPRVRASCDERTAVGAESKVGD